MSETPLANRLHIALVGRRNAGKSSLINALTNQDIALVSATPGTTTDPVTKAMEILPLGPVALIDTAGIDDTGELGALRIERTLRVLRHANLAILVLDPTTGVGEPERDLLERLERQAVPVVVVVNKSDAVNLETVLPFWEEALGLPILTVSAKTGRGIGELKDLIAQVAADDPPEPPLLKDLVAPGDTVVLVTPIDLAAPRGRLILPQVQALREILDCDATAVVVKETQLAHALHQLRRRPDLVITDSQAFRQVADALPWGVPLTSFSILFARQKGDLDQLIAGARALERLVPGDRVLISEACTHDRKCGDIGTEQIPRLLCKQVGGDLAFTWTSGQGFPDDPGGYRLAVHCGGCMINRREMLSRLEDLGAAGVPVVNYGVLMAHCHGILGRALEPVVGPVHPRDEESLVTWSPV